MGGDEDEDDEDDEDEDEREDVEFTKCCVVVLYIDVFKLAAALAMAALAANSASSF